MVGTPVALLDRLRKLHLIAGAERDLLQRRDAAGGGIDPVDAALLQLVGECDGLLDVPAALDPVGRRHPHADRLVGGNAARTASNTSSGKRMRFSRRAAIFVGAPVGDRRQELMQQIAVRAVQLDGVDAEPLGAFGRSRRRRRGCARARRRRARAAAASPSLCGTADGATRPPAALRLAGSAGRRPRAVCSTLCGRHARAASRPPSRMLAHRGEDLLQRRLGRVAVEPEAARRDAADRPPHGSPRCRTSPAPDSARLLSG